MIETRSVCDSEWLDFISTHGSATIFHHPAWASLLASAYDYRPFLLVKTDASGRITAGMPFMEVRSILTGWRWVSMPFSDSCAPLCSTTAELESIVDFLHMQYSRRMIPRVEIHARIGLGRGIHQEGDYVRHSVRLTNDANDLLRTFNKTRVREPIRQASRRGLEIRLATDQTHMSSFYEMLLATRRRRGAPAQPRYFFDLLWKTLIQRGLGFLLLAYSEGRAIAGTVYLAFGGTLTAKYNASDPSYWRLRPNDALYWEAMKWGCEQGCRIFDFGRTESSDLTLREFKNGWGAIEEPLTYSIIGEQRAHGASRRAGRITQAIVRNSPSYVCQLLGELLYKHYA